MTLEELMAEFPHGSRWTHRRTGIECRVVGWDPEIKAYDVGSILHRNTIGDLTTTSTSPRVFRETNTRIPDPAPNPISEPVTLPTITLHPDGTYTWEGGPE